jgi:hypothetical protein
MQCWAIWSISVADLKKPDTLLSQIEELKAAGASLGSVPKVVERFMENKCPELLAKFYPRVYESTGGYWSPRQCAAFLTYAVASGIRTGLDHADSATRMLMPALHLMVERRMPQFFIAPDLLEAVKRTDFPDEINWAELRMPFEQGIFMLPRQSFIHPKTGEVAMIVWARLKPGEYQPPAPGIPVMTEAYQSIRVICLCPEKARWYQAILEDDQKPLRLQNPFDRTPGDKIPQVILGPLDLVLDEKDAVFIDEMFTIAFGTFMVMNARPQLVERGELIRRVTKAGQTREFWTPNIIGPKYKLKREVPKIIDGKFVYDGQREHGTHASPRMHWRRGHHRFQAHGAGRRERKEIWVEPTLIGGQAASCGEEQ